MKKTITEEKTCPACEGRGKSFGRRHCSRCHGRNTVTETTTVEISAPKSNAFAEWLAWYILALESNPRLLAEHADDAREFLGDRR